MSEEFKAFLELIVLIIGVYIANVFIEDPLTKVGVNISAVILTTSLQLKMALSGVFEKLDSVKRELKAVNASLNFVQLTLNEVIHDRENLYIKITDEK